MKKSIALFLIFCFLFMVVNPLCCEKEAYADGLTMFALGGALYSIAQTVGFTVRPEVATSGSSQTWAENLINSWLHGRTLTQAFGSEIIRLTAGKLVVGQRIYNGIMEMLGLKAEEAGIEPGESITYGNFYGRPYSGRVQTNPFYSTGAVIPFDESYTDVGIYTTYVNNTMTTYVNGAKMDSWSGANIIGWGLVSYRNRDGIDVFAAYENGERWFRYDNILRDDVGNMAEITLSEDYSNDPIDVGYQWEGTVDGTAPDTNLDQLIGQIYQDVADNNLVVDGDIVEPGPAPTPIPTYPPVDDIIPGINTGIEIGNDLIVGQQTQTGAITQGLEGVQDAVGSLEGKVEAIVDTPTSEELPDFKFDLRELFPFCIPFDIYRLLSSFDAEPAAPHVQLPIVIDSINFRYNLDLDFSSWNPVAQAMRTAELIVYAIALAWSTGKVIKW